LTTEYKDLIKKFVQVFNDSLMQDTTLNIYW